MNISKKRSVENNELPMAIKFALQIKDFINTYTEEKKRSLKNYWLQKKEIKDQVKEHDNKLDEIARFVTKYINSRKKG